MTKINNIWPFLIFLSRFSYAGYDLPEVDQKEIESKEAEDKSNCNSPYGQAFDDVSQLTEFMNNTVDENLPKHKQRFCLGNPRDISKRILDQTSMGINFENTLAFPNPPGPINTGMCWLHTRMQRNFTYLANFRPDLPKPTDPKKIDEIINRIVNREGVTEIPGFRNLREFSKTYKKELVDAITTMGWKCVGNINDCAARIPDSFDPGPKTIQGTMEKIYERRLKQFGEIQMIRTRIPDHNLVPGVLKPFVAHSLLILDMEPIREPKKSDEVIGKPIGYELKVIDPNYPEVVENVQYKFGDKSLRAGHQKIIPYTHYEYDGDVPEMKKLVDDYCKK